MAKLKYINDEVNIHNSVFVAPNAVIIGKVTIDENSSIWYNCVIRGDVDEIIIGKNSNVQDGCILHCNYNVPVILGNNVSIGHGAIIHGCTIEDNVLVGMGAIILSGAVIGKNSLIAAGSLITEKTIIPPNSLVVGSPAKVKMQVTEKHLKLIESNAINYIDYANSYKEKMGKV